jgi:PAS domain-containing protein
MYEEPGAEVINDEAREQLRELMDASTALVTLLDETGRVRSASSQGLALMEATVSTPAVGADWLDVWEGEKRQKAEEALSVALAGGVGSFQSPSPITARVPKWWDVVVVEMHDEHGEGRLLAITRDITAQRAERQRLIDDIQGLARLNEELEAKQRDLAKAESTVDRLMRQANTLK